MLSYIFKKIYCAIYVSWFPLKQIKGASAMERSPNCRLTSDLLLLSPISLRNFSALSHFLLKAIYIFRNKERKTCVFSFLCVLQRPQAASVPRNPIPCSRGDLSLSRLLSLSLSLSHWLSITLYWPCENTLTIPQSKPFVHATPYTSDPVPVHPSGRQAELKTVGRMSVRQVSAFSTRQTGFSDKRAACSPK